MSILDGFVMWVFGLLLNYWRWRTGRPAFLAVVEPMPESLRRQTLPTDTESAASMAQKGMRWSTERVH